MLVAVVLIVLFVVGGLFTLKNRTKNFQAVADKTHDLNSKGIKEVFLVQQRFPSTNDNRLSKLTLWGMPGNVGTADLMYVKDGQLVYEAPWWNTSSPIETFESGSTSIGPGEARQLVNIISRLRQSKMPGILINNRLFFVIGINLTDPDQAKRATHYQSWNYKTLDSNRQAMLSVLTASGFSRSSNIKSD